MVWISSITIDNIEPFLEIERAWRQGCVWVVKTESSEAVQGIQHPVGQPCQWKYPCVGVEGAVTDCVGEHHSHANLRVLATLLGGTGTGCPMEDLMVAQRVREARSYHQEGNQTGPHRDSARRPPAPGHPKPCCHADGREIQHRGDLGQKRESNGERGAGQQAKAVWRTLKCQHH